MDNVTVVLLSGGKGSRMQETVPKQYLQLAGKPMIMHLIERFDRIDSIDKIVVVCDPSYNDSILQMAKEYNISKLIEYVNAGATRQESVFNGLKNVNTNSVIIHEAARPFVRTAEFINLINDDSENITLGYDIPFTVLKGHEEIEGLLNRSELVNIQLPQKFNTSDLKRAHEKAISEGNAYTEDASLVYNELNVPIKILKGKSYNLKITEPVDLLFGEIIYKTYISNRH